MSALTTEDRRPVSLLQRERPLRVELLGDEVESIREFDPASQRSEGKLPYAVAPPPRELLLDRSLVIRRSDAIRDSPLVISNDTPNRRPAPAESTMAVNSKGP